MLVFGIGCNVTSKVMAFLIHQLLQLFLKSHENKVIILIYGLSAVNLLIFKHFAVCEYV